MDTSTKTQSSAEEFVDKLLTQDAADAPSDDVKPEELVMELPKNFDEKMFNRGREFYANFSFAFSSATLMGLIAVFAVPSIAKILSGSRRSNSVFTAYRRYISTLLHIQTWFQYELKPGTTSWKSLYTVRNRHLRAGMASKLKGTGVVSQRDVALTLWGFVGYVMLKPDKFGIRQLQPGDWDAYIYFWRTIGHMLGLQDRYNVCRGNAEETRVVCQLIQDRVYTPCLENVPENFEHLARVMLEGLSCVNPTIEIEGFLYWCRTLTDVPGYIYTEADRQNLQKKLKNHLKEKGKPLDTGVDVKELICESAVEGLPKLPPRILYYSDYDTIETAPAYKMLKLKARYKIFMYNLYMTIYTSWLGRWYFNLNFKFILFLINYFPYLAFIKFRGIKKCLVNIFEEDPTDDTTPKKNSEYYKPYTPEPWYKAVLSIIW